MSERPPAGRDMVAEMERIVANLPKPAIMCHPDDRDQLRAAMTASWPLWTPQPELLTSTLVEPGTTLWIADTRIAAKPDRWEYGRYDLDDDQVSVFDLEPRIVPPELDDDEVDDPHDGCTNCPYGCPDCPRCDCCNCQIDHQTEEEDHDAAAL